MDNRYRYTERTVRKFERERDEWKAVATLAMLGMFGSILFFVTMIWGGCP